MSRCPECGAPSVEGHGCREQLGLLIAWEYDDPELRAEHFLTVASFNLQHPARFTDEAHAGLREVFIDYVERVVSLTEIRRRVSHATEGAVRVLRAESARRPVLRRWSMTIADVYLPNQPAGAAERVRLWARTIRSEI